MSSLARERVVPSVGVVPANQLEPVKMLYVLIEAEAENKASTLKSGELHLIGVGGDLRWMCRSWF